MIGRKDDEPRIPPAELVRHNALATPQELLAVPSGSIIEIERNEGKQIPHQTAQAHKIMSNETTPHQQEWIGTGKFRVYHDVTLTTVYIQSLEPKRYGRTQVGSWTTLECVEGGYGTKTGTSFAFLDTGSQIQNLTFFKFNKL